MKNVKKSVVALLLFTSLGYGQVGIDRTGINNVTSINKPGDNNSVGLDVLKLTTSYGIRNSGFGFRAMFANTDGFENTAFGYRSLFYNQLGSYNTSVGSDAGQKTGSTPGSTPKFNSYFGYKAGFEVNSGNSNTIIGAQVASSLVNNVIPNVATISNHVIIGDGSGNPRIFINDKGNMGLGNTNPQAKLELTSGTTGASGLRFTNLLSTSTAAAANGRALTVDASGNVILVPMVAAPAVTNSWTNVGNAVTFNGKVCIATTTAPENIGGVDIKAYRLFVKGGILTDQVRVQTNWADYVFASDYTLKPLAEVEKYIAANKHLPNVPSAKTVEAEGVSVGDMLRIQQEKIEELTLYLIEQNKKIDVLQKQVNDIASKK